MLPWQLAPRARQRGMRGHLQQSAWDDAGHVAVRRAKLQLGGPLSHVEAVASVGAELPSHPGRNGGRETDGLLRN